MRCEICTNNPWELVILPIKQNDGKLDTIACMGCAYESEHYCHEHDRPKLGFEDDSSACTECIEQTVRDSGEKLAAKLSVKIIDSENRPLVTAAVDVYLEGIEMNLMNVDLGGLPLAIKIAGANNAQHIARPVITYAFRKRISLDDAIGITLEKPGLVYLGMEEFDRD